MRSVVALLRGDSIRTRRQSAIVRVLGLFALVEQSAAAEKPTLAQPA
jgi:hypothetical protein